MNIIPSEISFKSYKRFPRAEHLELKPMTLLLGKNSSGKSSIIKLLLSISEAISGKYTRAGLPYKGDGYSIGSSFQNICHNGNMLGLKVGVNFRGRYEFKASLMMTPANEVVINHYFLRTPEQTIDAKLESNGMYTINGQSGVKLGFMGLISDNLIPESFGMKFPKFDMDYIGPLRAEPERTWYVSGTSFNHVGANGIHAYQMIYEDKEILGKVNGWFEENLEGCSLDIAKGEEPGSYRVMVSRPDNGDYKVNIADVGMGIIQALPIVVRAFLEKPGSIVGIEQPELHLHPAAHAAIARLLAQTSKELKHTYVVETHSENFLLGIREMVVNPECDFNSDDVIVYFIDEDEDGAYIKPIGINPDGTLTDWPSGVFNESYDLLKSIMKNSRR